MTLIRNSKFHTKLLKRAGASLTAVATLMLLGACANTENITSVDHSADYSSAVSLPPLKKTSQTPAAATQVAVESQQMDAVVEKAPVEEAVMDAPVEAKKDTVAESEMSTDDTSQSIEPSVGIASSPASISAKVLNPNSGAARLLIENGFEASWGYLSDNLKQSDLTVFSRNKSAGRFSIGCADIDEAPIVEKQGGWTFRNKKKERLEYCALQAVSTKGSTLVTVLNRAGEEVIGEYAAKIFERILNN